MYYFAHNGVNHGTAAEAASHSLLQIIITLLFVSLVVAALMSIAAYVAHRFALSPVRIDEEERKDKS